MKKLMSANGKSRLDDDIKRNSNMKISERILYMNTHVLNELNESKIFITHDIKTYVKLFFGRIYS